MTQRWKMEEIALFVTGSIAAIIGKKKVQIFRGWDIQRKTSWIRCQWTRISGAGCWKSYSSIQSD